MELLTVSNYQPYRNFFSGWLSLYMIQKLKKAVKRNCVPSRYSVGTIKKKKKKKKMDYFSWLNINSWRSDILGGAEWATAWRIKITYAEEAKEVGDWKVLLRTGQILCLPLWLQMAEKVKISTIWSGKYMLEITFIFNRVWK